MKENSRLSWSILGAGLGLLLVLACLFAYDSAQQTIKAPATDPPPGQQPPEVTEAPPTDPPPGQQPPEVTEAPPTDPPPGQQSTQPPEASTAVPVGQQAVQEASTVLPVVYESFGVQINPAGAAGLDAALVNGTQGDLAGWMAPVVNAYQTYTDRSHLKREVEGVFGIISPSLRLETTIIVNRTYRFYSPLPPGEYMLACHIQRPSDCIAVSLEGREYRIRAESIDTITLPPTAFPPIEPGVAYVSGSIHKCFRVAWRRICVRVF